MLRCPEIARVPDINMMSWSGTTSLAGAMQGKIRQRNVGRLSTTTRSLCRAINTLFETKGLGGVRFSFYVGN